MVNDATTVWQEVCFVQFLSVSEGDVYQAIRVAPKIFLIVSVGAQHTRSSFVRPKRHAEFDAVCVEPAHVRREEELHVKMCFFVARGVDTHRSLRRPKEGRVKVT